uniref:Uncharacterized protein n=1 Tax=Meloidogyne javanica TaxID=6303 RepID=A0A915MEJ7_MELJA
MPPKPIPAPQKVIKGGKGIKLSDNAFSEESENSDFSDSEVTVEYESENSEHHNVTTNDNKSLSAEKEIVQKEKSTIFTKKYICVLGRPNEKYVDDINHEDKIRINNRLNELGVNGLLQKRMQLQNAIEQNSSLIIIDTINISPALRKYLLLWSELVFISGANFNDYENEEYMRKRQIVKDSISPGIEGNFNRLI